MNKNAMDAIEMLMNSVAAPALKKSKDVGGSRLNFSA